MGITKVDAPEEEHNLDTGTHIAMGIALGGLATLDPVVAQDPALHQAILIGTVIGSNAPDFDTILKFKGNATYLRHHRGFTHSIPAVFIWSLLISVVIFIFIAGISFFHIWLWTLLAVSLHVFVDIFNAYGTQALRPFSNKWIALGIINTFDPFILSTHLIAIGLWLYGFTPGPLFLLLYLIISLYYGWRIYVHNLLIRQVKRKLNAVEDVIVSPTINWNRWLIAVKTERSFYVAHANKLEISILDVYNRVPIPNTPVFNAAKQDPNLSAFLSFSPVYRWEVDESGDHYEVRFIDLRYRSRGHYPFVAVVKLDEHLNIIQSFTGWVHNKEKLRKKLRPVNNY